MKLRCAWESVSKKADKSKGVADIELTEHLAATEQDNLPQARILSGALERLKEKGLVEEAYLRGSMGRGHADIHSDIDLFAVVKPEDIETAYDEIREFLKEGGGIITDCHDRLVEDYGGIGFMFVAHDKDAEQIFQFDFYMAMKGVPPKNETSIKPRMYSKDPDYKWTEEYGRPRDMSVIPDDSKAFIKRHTEGQDSADRMELIMQELLISLFVANKHIKRGQISRTVIDNNAIVTSAIEMLQELTQYRSTGYSAVYLGNEVVDIARQYGDEEMIEAADKLEKLFSQPMTQDKLRDTLEFGKFVLERAYPEKFEKQREAIELFEREVLGVSKAEIKSPQPKNPKV